MSRSIQLVRIAGIRIGVDPSWFLVLFLIIWSLSSYFQDLFPGEDTKSFLLAVLAALLFFTSIVLHELGHAWVAMRNGIEIEGIDLWLLGGVARLRRDSRTPGEEFRIAAAGPAVTLIITVVCLGAAMLLAGTDDGWGATRFDEGAQVGEAEAVLGYLAFVNFFLFAFNLIPAFPLDGGRIARAIAWWRTGDRSRATRLAATLGRFFGWLLGGIGVVLALNGLLITGVWLVFIGVFLAQAARSATVQTAVTERLEGLRVADVMDPDPVAVPSQTKLDTALDEFFYRYRSPWFPVIDPTGHFLGLLIREKVDEVPEELRATWTVDEVLTPEQSNSFHVDVDDPLEALLGSDALQRLGAIMATDDSGKLRGVVTVDRVRRALRPAAP